MTSSVHDHQLRQLRQKIQAVNEDYDQLMQKLAKDSRCVRLLVRVLCEQDCCTLVSHRLSTDRRPLA